MGTFHIDGTLSVKNNLKLWSDAEGANIRFITASDSNKVYELDTNSGNLRLYYCIDGGTGASGYKSWLFSPDGSLTAAKFIGSLQGNADTATKLKTTRTISLTGSVTGSGSFDGSGNLSITTTTNHNHDDKYVNITGDTMTGSLQIGNSGQTSYLECKIFRGAKNNRIYLCANNGNGGHIVAANDDSSSQIDFQLTQTVFNKPIQTSDLVLLKNGVTSSISSNNSSYLHFSTSASTGYYFNKNLYVNGDIYAGSGYNDLVLTKANYHGSIASSRLQDSASGWHVVYINSATAWMTAFTIRVYQAYSWSDVVISGYNYSDQNWYSPQAVIMGTTGVDSMTVYFGYTTTRNLWVAIPASNYYGIDIVDCTNGYQAFDSWKDLFTLQYVSGAANKLPGTIQTTVTARSPWYRGQAITGAVWNDYAEYRESDCKEFGRVLIEKGDDSLTQSTERLQHFAGISSDTWGFCQGETEKAKTPIAVAGRVLVYPYQDRDNYKPGDCVCAAPGGTVDIMTREEVINWPDRIIGTVSCIPDYEEWGSGDRDPVKVNGRIWIKVK